MAPEIARPVGRRTQAISPPIVVWFRNDLRLADNTALNKAVRREVPIIPLFIWAPQEFGEWAPGAASRWWLHQSLTHLDADLKRVGAKLIFRSGDSLAALRDIVSKTRAAAVFWNIRYEPAPGNYDRVVERELQAQGCEVKTFQAGFLTDPGAVRNSSGKPFQVFSSFWRSCLRSMEPEEPAPAPRKLTPFLGRLSSEPLSAFKLEPEVNWTSGISAVWQPGEAGAWRALRRFSAAEPGQYRLNRDRPGVAGGASRLSAHLHFGEITARQVWHCLRLKNAGTAGPSWKSSQFITEIGWREFAHHLLCHFPQTPTRPLRVEFERFPWRPAPTLLKAWQRGRTGYPIVDAGMRELWATGWMHNRVRMIAASFLVKDLLITWQEGARWFWDTLVDADLANNTLGWQWTAGCGADAAPFFRIFNPVTQGEKFDPDGTYVRRWIPELASLHKAWIHKPWHAPAEALERAGVILGRDYAMPIVDHAAARLRALAAFQSLKPSRRAAPRPF
ncbi:MAG TPA: deoxyribodipyrimidine photo-lyase [Patescibacteria group bacterium]|nr:deoxyribodipyrimidine photo-lyase [Patescibacteria group bacterium]